MTKEDIIRMVREIADKDKVDPYSNWFVVLTPEELKSFAAIIVAVEREACARVAEEPYEFTSEESHRIAAAIRARSEK